MTTPLPLRSAATGYRKGEETRARILAAALSAFGNQGFAAVTTRQIAEEAGANLPALNYYFGNKQGLYLACAHEIVARYREGMGAVGGVALAALQAPLEADAARVHLKRLMAALARFLLSSAGAQDRTLFVQREMASPGPAFEILYAELWRPGIELAAELIAQASGGKLETEDARVRAVMMIASLTGFQSGGPVIARSVGEGDQVARVIAALDAQVDALTA